MQSFRDMRLIQGVAARWGKGAKPKNLESNTLSSPLYQVNTDAELLLSVFIPPAVEQDPVTELSRVRGISD